MLRGISWAHSRGMAPLLALSEVWRDRHGALPIAWDSRPLWSFAEDPLDAFNDTYDLIVFDYPFAGEAISSGWLTPIDQLLSAQECAERRAGAVGRAFDSFVWNGRAAALPIDAATHVCVWRPDLLDRLGGDLPTDLAETLTLAETTGAVIMPMTPTALWGALITICANGGALPMREEDAAFQRGSALAGMDWLRAMARCLPAACARSSPVAVLNTMALGDSVTYCPLTYGYASYAMAGYADHPLRFGNIRLAGNTYAGGAVLGGAGIGVSSRSRDPSRAAAVAAWLTSTDIQATLYAQFGGQPVARAAWESPVQNLLTGDFYASTRASIDGCYHRPNMPGFHAFQTRSAGRIHKWVHDRDGTGGATAVLDAIDGEWTRLAERSSVAARCYEHG